MEGLLLQIKPQTYKSTLLPEELKYITLQNQRKRKISNYVIQDEIRQLERYIKSEQLEIHTLNE